MRSIYDTRRPKHPHSPIRWYERCPQVSASFSPLYGILPWHGLIFDTYMSTVLALRQHHDHCEQSITASRSRLFLRQISKASVVVNIGSSALSTVSDFIRLILFDLIWITVFYLIQLNVSDLVWLTVSDLIQIIVSDLIQLTFLTGFDSVFLFGSTNV